MKGEPSFFLELLGGLNKRAREVDPDNLRNLAGEFKGASTDGATQIQSPLRLVLGLCEEKSGAGKRKIGYSSWWVDPPRN
jgi:hypothetical protein